jgi:STE24 endopeptidase
VSVAGLDPQTAADRYVEALSPALRAAGAAYAEQSHWAWVISGLLIVAICWVTLRLGLLQRLRAGLEQERPRPWYAAFACALALSALVAALTLPLDVAAAWLADRTLMRPPSSLIAYVAGAVRSDCFNILAVSLGAAVLLSLTRLAPKAWWAWSGAALSVAIFALVWGSYALAGGPAHSTPVPAGEARDGLLKLIHDAGLSARQVYLVASPDVDGDVTGLPGAARVVVNQGMLDHASVPEMRAAIGHLAGHFVRGDQFGLAALLSLLTVGALLAIHRLFGPAARLLGAEGLAGLSDPAGLPVWAVIAVAWLAIATPAEKTYIRLINVRADQFSLDHAREPDGLAVSLLRGWHDDKVDPGPLEEAVFFDHPSLQSRLEHAMRWKASHQIAVPRPAALKAPKR